MKNECDKPFENNNVTNDLFTETVVQDVTYKQIETECENVKVLIEFPDQSKNMETVKKEVEQLLSSILKEQIIQIQ